MAYYDALIAEWPSIAGQDTPTKLTTLNALTVALVKPAILSPSQVLNAIVPADLASMTTAQVAMLTLLLQGSSVDCSKNSTIRAAAQVIFAAKPNTLTALAALVAPFDNSTQLWTTANGYGVIGPADLLAAGGLT